MHEALCSTLQLEKAISACIQAAPETFPIDGIFLNYYRDDIQSIQFLALATRNRSRIKLNVLSIPIHVLSRFIVSDNFTTTILNRLADDPLTDYVIKHHFRKVKSAIVMRLKVDDIRLGAVVFFSYKSNAFQPEHAELVESLRGSFSLLASRALSQLKLISEQKTHTQYSHLPSSDNRGKLPEGFISAQNSPMAALFSRLPSIAKSQQAVMIYGEKGSGKSMLAHHLYQQSAGPQSQLAALYAETLTLFITSPDQSTRVITLTEAMLTDNTLFEYANGGTLLIENIECLPEAICCQLIRNIQIYKEKGNSTRILITQTQLKPAHTDPANLLRCIRYYNLFCLSVTLLPLRQRREDIPELVTHYLLKLGKTRQHKLPLLSTRFQQSLLNYDWPGNISELIARLEKAIISSGANILDIKPGEYDRNYPDIRQPILPLNEIVKRHIIETLKQTNGKISGEGGAAEILKINSNTLYSKMKKLGITKDIFSQEAQNRN
ncbi:sigma-54-dependent Fis family transcriptional regulator [Limnobaculum zhutongyuii]|uniref:Sigma-54-dependent Fis family transcriptional regulator n=1 Tax=Limnobaculum zhutongyuii TaxID=2498113 RepID=A0A411WNS7_9GAMM|nr:sigma 54-interacting transcriptional regulator [Limnobaculum zhutongyuii]QBH97827.1 sigma-54-dependent Fis family transcriptional regulator [Limnobaculum zhutongyuii]TQS87883.1 sigma-54-dependent Fis family transcriptional regulator [Limnobaculum zhutongyuii]